jgi:TIR domain/Tripartite tricarboxylate transporter TctB family
VAGKIFINYRRGDDPGFTGRLFDFLERNFSSEQLFIDVDNISAGEDFARVLDAQVGQCDVMLSVIGQDWLDAKAEDGSRRLDSPKDFVRFEIESALRLDKRVIPVLVNQANMPREEVLPPSLAAFTRRNAVRITHERFRAEAQGLVGALKRALADADTARKAAAEQAADASRREQAARLAEAARQRELDAAARAQAAAQVQKEPLDADAEVAALERRIAEIKARAAGPGAVEPQRPEAVATPHASAPVGRTPPAPTLPPPLPDEVAPVRPRQVEQVDPRVDTIAIDAAASAAAARGPPLSTSRELWTGLLFFATGSTGAISLVTGPDVQSASGRYPVFIASALILVGLAALIKSGVSARSTIERIQWRAPAFIIAACAAFGALLDVAGVVVALTVLGVLSFAAVSSDRFDWRAVATYVLVIGGMASLFIWGLKLPIPLFGRLLTG